jgi:hypothetical protein
METLPVGDGVQAGRTPKKLMAQMAWDRALPITQQGTLRTPQATGQRAASNTRLLVHTMLTLRDADCINTDSVRAADSAQKLTR